MVLSAGKQRGFLWHRPTLLTQTSQTIERQPGLSVNLQLAQILCGNVKYDGILKGHWVNAFTVRELKDHSDTFYMINVIAA